MFKLSGSIMTLLLLIAPQAYGNNDYSQVHEKIRKINPEMSITNVRETPIQNILELEINDSQLIYSSEDGNYIFTGQMIDISQGTNNNLTESRQQEIRSRLLSEMNSRTFITFPAKGHVIGEVFVFTDTSCGYCRNFHKQIEAINEGGVSVHYIAFPRSGLQDPVAALMEKVWCASDPRAALTEAKLSGRVTQAAIPCQAPVAEHFQTGMKMGVHGTPYILTKDGRKLGGYLSAADLISKFD